MTSGKYTTRPYPPFVPYAPGATCSSLRAVSGRCFCGAGENSVIKRAIIDDNVSIGRNVKITNKDNIQDADYTDDGYVIQHGIVVVLKGATIRDGTEI